MQGFRLTQSAKADLVKIRRYTVMRWGEQQSQKYLSQLRQKMQLLSETPTIGVARPDVGVGIYSFPHMSHVIYYIEQKQHIVVFGVLHSSMIPQKHLSEHPLS